MNWYIGKQKEYYEKWEKAKACGDLEAARIAKRELDNYNQLYDIELERVKNHCPPIKKKASDNTKGKIAKLRKKIGIVK